MTSHWINQVADTKAIRPFLAQPWTIDGCTFASNGMVAVILDGERGFPECPDLAKGVDRLLAAPYVGPPLRADYEKLVSFCGAPANPRRCPTCGGEGQGACLCAEIESEEECPECEGEGVMCCPTCRGFGQVDVAPRYGRIGESVFNLYWLAYILDHVPAPSGGAVEFRSEGEEGAGLFSAPGWQVYIMPCRAFPVDDSLPRFSALT